MICNNIIIFSNDIALINKIKNIFKIKEIKIFEKIPKEMLTKRDNIEEDLIIVDETIFLKEILDFKKLLVFAFNVQFLFFNRKKIIDYVGEMDGVRIIDEVNINNIKNILDLDDKSKKQIVGVWEWDFETGTVAFDYDYYKMLGFEKNIPFASYGSWKMRIHPEEQKDVEKKILEFIDNDCLKLEFYFRIKNSKNVYVKILSKNSIVKKNNYGKKIRMRGINKIFI